mmetsp:Transcript_13942/g.40855  ORF Transcript_13942/g.40855 Transcript_13942/m.40855 type:complete len:90 (-) Transcript_13942:370-639(-)
MKVGGWLAVAAAGMLLVALGRLWLAVPLVEGLTRASKATDASHHLRSREAHLVESLDGRVAQLEDLATVTEMRLQEVVAGSILQAGTHA